MRQKADDIAGFFGCFDCHTSYDSEKEVGENISDFIIMRAMYRTIRRLVEKGIIKIKDHPLGDNYANTFRVEDGVLKVLLDPRA